MSDVNPDSKDESKAGKTEGVNFSERYSDVMGKVNESLSKIDWTQMGKYGKAAGIIAVVVLAQVLIKVVIDTVNFFPILPKPTIRIFFFSKYLTYDVASFSLNETEATSFR